MKLPNNTEISFTKANKSKINGQISIEIGTQTNLVAHSIMTNNLLYIESYNFAHT